MLVSQSMPRISNKHSSSSHQSAISRGTVISCFEAESRPSNHSPGAKAKPVPSNSPILLFVKEAVLGRRTIPENSPGRLGLISEPVLAMAGNTVAELRSHIELFLIKAQKEPNHGNEPSFLFLTQDGKEYLGGNKKLAFKHTAKGNTKQTPAEPRSTSTKPKSKGLAHEMEFSHWDPNAFAEKEKKAEIEKQVHDQLAAKERIRMEKNSQA